MTAAHRPPPPHSWTEVADDNNDKDEKMTELLRSAPETQGDSMPICFAGCLSFSLSPSVCYRRDGEYSPCPASPLPSTPAATRMHKTTQYSRLVSVSASSLSTSLTCILTSPNTPSFFPSLPTQLSTFNSSKFFFFSPFSLFTYLPYYLQHFQIFLLPSLPPSLSLYLPA